MENEKEKAKPKELIIVRKQKDGTEIREKTGLTREEFDEMVKVVSLGEKSIKESKKQLAGISENIKETCRDIFWASQNDKNVLILGETGTGKEIVAREIHKQSKRHDQPFIVLHPAGLTETIADAELFGSARGAYTEARDRHGLVAEANGGTLFIDEIAYLPLPVQSKLLRLIQFKTYRRLGEVKERNSDFRLICATNRALGELIDPARTIFLPDLYYRIAKVVIKISPLRERREDILPIFFHLIKRHYPEVDIRKLSMSWNSLYCLLMSDWGGNVRELESLIESNPVKKRKLAKETAYFPFEVFEQIKGVCSFQKDRYDMSHPVAAGWGDELINVVTFEKKLKGAPKSPFWEKAEDRLITSLSDLSYLDVEKVLVDEGRKLEALPKYEKQREEYKEEKRKLEEQREQRPPSLLGTLRNLGLDTPPLSKDTLLGSLQSSKKLTPLQSHDSLDSLAKKGIPLQQIEKEYLNRFLHHHPIKKGQKGKSLLNRAQMLGLRPSVLDRKIKKYSSSGSSKTSK
jgi:DNA-binding NtrC family response regulator